MKITLNHISIENFKGIKTFSFGPNGGNSTISGVNGSGKTTVYDAFLWNLFGKCSDGRKDFSVRPLDEDNQPIPELVTVVETELNRDGKTIVLKKELHEKRVKGQMRGYETLCWIDLVPKKVGEYNDAIAELVPEQTFKMLTDLHFFNEKLHWTDRRKVLMEIAGDIEQPEGFSELIEAADGRSMEDYKKVCTDQKKRLEKERDEIGPRIDELNRGLEQYAGQDSKELQDKREDLKTEIAELDKQRQTALDGQTKRAEQLEEINQMKGKKADRENALKNDDAGHTPLIAEKQDIQKKIANKETQVDGIKRQEVSAKANIDTQKKVIEAASTKLQSIRDAFVSGQDMDFSAEKCSACGQVLPAESVDRLKVDHQKKMDKLAQDGTAAKEVKLADEAKLETMESELKAIQETREKAEIELAEGRTYADQRITQIDEALSNRIVTKPENDPIWKQICADIEAAEQATGAPVVDRLNQIEEARKEMAVLLEEINKTLAAVDQNKTARDRIAELDAKRKELSGQIADTDKTIARIGDYVMAVAGKVEATVNSHFKYITFKMFKVLLNESVEPCCEAVLNGTPYSDTSYGEKVRIGCDIITVLEQHFNMAVPVFIDNSESLTFSPELNGQKILLKADPKADTLKVENTTDQPEKSDKLF